MTLELPGTDEPADGETMRTSGGVVPPPPPPPLAPTIESSCWRLLYVAPPQLQLSGACADTPHADGPSWNRFAGFVKA